MKRWSATYGSSGTKAFLTANCISCNLSSFQLCFVASWANSNSNLGTGYAVAPVRCNTVPPPGVECKVASGSANIDFRTLSPKDYNGKRSSSNVAINCTSAVNVRFSSTGSITLNNNTTASLTINGIKSGGTFPIGSGISNHTIEATLSGTPSRVGTFSGNAIIILDIL
ncbi:hypothetical protein [Enterobacter hormaechei]|uniref:MrpH family fimbial adhesin n=1 Tax=Enterobacter hormaechei TaxID=158836 RepID=UPI003D72E655